jgi:signal transduction histidine kinase
VRGRLSKRQTTLFRSYFATFALVATFPLIFGIATEVWFTFKRQAAEAEALRKSEATRIAANIEADIAAVTTLLSGIKNAISTSGATQEMRGSELKRAILLYEKFRSLRWVDAENIERIRVSLRGLDEVDGKSVTQHLALAVEARRSGKAAFARGLDGRYATILIAQAGRGAGGDVLILEFVLSTGLAAVVENHRFLGGGYVFITDETGRVIAHPDVNVALRGDMFNDATRSSGSAPELGKLASGDASSSASFVTFTTHRMQAPSWIVVAAQPHAHSQSWIRDALLRAAALVLLALLLAAALATWSAKRTVEPIVALARQVQSLQPGQTMAVSASGSHVREVYALASQFAAMSERLSAEHETLEQRVLEKTSQLLDANRALETASRNKSAFLTHVSHELRTPLNAVIGFSEMLSSKYFGDLNEKQLRYAKDINASGQHLMALINDLLDLAKIEAGKLDLVRSHCSVDALLRDCAAIMGNEIERARQTLRLSIPDDSLSCSLDARKFKQCVLNLLSNAHKFTPDGGEIELGARMGASSLEVWVRDNGMGMDETQQARLFQEFYRANDVSRAEGANRASLGTGLGLTLTRRIVELHGGRVVVQSQIGKGSIFTVLLPVEAVR